MPNFYPPWKDMTDAQKFDFLYEWLLNTDQAFGNLRGGIQELHERLRKVEAENAQRPKPETPDQN